MKHSILVLAGALALAVASSASAHPTTTSILIRHQVRGCHAWAVNGGAYKVAQTVRLEAGASIHFINDDVMPHKLVKVSGPAVTMKNVVPAMGMGLKGPFAPGMMGRMHAGVHVTFTKPGTYRLKTVAGEDYKGMPEMKTTGEDNVLTLKVIVS